MLSKANRVYISGPMTGLPEFNKPAFDEAERFLRRIGYEPVNPANIHPPERQKHSDFMREDLKALLDCDSIYMLDGWQKSPGARIEMEVAAITAIPIWFQE